jgi:trehalose 6-phosphate phosphatase
MSRSLFGHWSEIESQVQEANAVWLGTDFDGTLTEHQPEPHLVSLDDSVRQTLDSLARRSSYSVAVVTGRSLQNIMQLVELDSIGYAGDHGYEIHTTHWQSQESLDEEAAAQLQYMNGVIISLIAYHTALQVDFKKYTMTMNFRHSSSEQRADSLRILTDAIVHCPRLKLRHLARGIEILPQHPTNKGTAALLLKERSVGRDALGVFIGDDLTDEDAFLALPDGITIHVGERETAARYRVDSPSQVADFLARLAKMPDRRQALETGKSVS